MDIKDSNREAFEVIPGNARLLRGAIFKDGEYVALSLFDESSKELAAQLNYGWSMWQAATAQAVPKWISVNDNLPPANILVLGMSQTRSNIFNIYNVMDLDEFEEADVTHWMPLPDAPQEPTND